MSASTRRRVPRVRSNVLHFEGHAPDYHLGGGIPCGAKGYTLNTTDNVDDVTCRTCIQILLNVTRPL